MIILLVTTNDDCSRIVISFIWQLRSHQRQLIFRIFQFCIEFLADRGIALGIPSCSILMRDRLTDENNDECQKLYRYIHHWETATKKKRHYPLDFLFVFWPLIKHNCKWKILSCVSYNLTFTRYLPRKTNFPFPKRFLNRDFLFK